MTRKEFSDKLKEIGLTKKEFCEILYANIGTVNNWGNENHPVPFWVESWLKNYSDSLKFKKAKELFGCADKPE